VRGDLAAAITDIGHYTDAFVEEFLADKLHGEALAAMAAPAAV
jgi:hypothetical protein